jgi:hypothetical protein
MRTSCLHYRCLLLLILTVISTCSGTQDKNKVPLEETITSHTFRPRRADATVERIKLLRVPPAFSISVFASGTGSPCMMKGMSDVRIYVADTSMFGRRVDLRNISMVPCWSATMSTASFIAFRVNKVQSKRTSYEK